MGLGLSLGPAIGGFLYSFGGYGLPFFVLGGIMLATIPMCCFIIRETTGKFDFAKPLVMPFCHILRLQAGEIATKVVPENIIHFQSDDQWLCDHCGGTVVKFS